MDNFGGFGKLTTLFQRDKVHHDNGLFKLHHQVNFTVLLVGVLFIFGENYLNGKAIVCKSSTRLPDLYANQYCWLHGTGHLHPDLATDITGACAMEVSQKDDRHTHYYLWLPFVLGLCMGLVKTPRIIWKNLCERGVMESLVGYDKLDAEKISARFLKVRKRSGLYLKSFAFCEILNIAMLLTCFQILDSLLNGYFWEYGMAVYHFYSGGRARNPMCNLFPTEVACNLCTGSIGGGCNDRQSTICILSNNIFNQYFFLILWFWWIILLSFSLLGLVYRFAHISIPSFSKFVLQSVYLCPFGLEGRVQMLPLTCAECFLLCRLALNLKGSTMEKVLKELKASLTTSMDLKINVNGKEKHSSSAEILPTDKNMAS